MSVELSLDEELKRGRFNHAILATYNFGAPFFEQYCLEKYESLATAANILIFLDRGQHDALLLAGAEERPRRAGMRYVLCPVRCAGVFHPKLYLFAASDRALLILGSSNLTRTGLTLNAEFAVALRFESGVQEQHLPVFGDAFRFFTALAERQRSESVFEALQTLSAACPWLPQNDDGSPTRPRILHSLDAPLWRQIRGPLAGPVERCAVLSPYFDATPAILDTIARDVAGGQVSIFTQAGPAGMSSQWLAHPSIGRGTQVFVTTHGSVDRPRALHAKAVLLAGPHEAVLAYGSANFTRAGWLSTPRDGNIETVLRLRGLPPSCDISELFDPLGLKHPAEAAELSQEVEPPPGRPARTPVNLVDAGLDGRDLTICFEPPDSVVVRWSAELTPHAHPALTVPLARGRQDLLAATLAADAVARCANGTTLVRLLAHTASGPPLVSNSVFLVQLQDPTTGRSARFDRRLREAQQDPERFAAVLHEMSAKSDSDELKRFLWACDMTIGAGRRLAPGLRRERPFDLDSMRRLGARNLAICVTVHEAAQSFIQRHVRRLEHHAREPSLATIPRFMKIARDVAEVARVQIARLLAGLQHHDDRMNAETWRRLREFFNYYLRAFSDLLVLVVRRYFVELKRHHPPKEVAADLAPDLGPLRELADDLLQTRERLDACGVTVLTPSGPKPAPFFAADVLGSEHGQWNTWTRELKHDRAALR